MKLRYHLALLILPLGLAACGDTKKEGAQAAAGGEVLEAGVSDAMVPLDSVRSQPPLAPRSVSEGDGSSAKTSEKGARKSDAPRAERPSSDEPVAAAQPAADPDPTPAGE